MPKENKNTSRRNRRQCSEVDNVSIYSQRSPRRCEKRKKEIASDTQDALKSVFGNNRYSPLFPREASRDSRAKKSIMFMPSIEDLHSMSGGIIENGIKYIMFPLHLLRFCIFGTSFLGSVDSKTNTEAEHAKSRDKNYKERTEKEERRKENESLKEEKNNNEESEDEMVTAEEDPDSSVEQWNSAKNTMAMNMSVDFDKTERSMSYVILEEPMDISIEEHGFDKSYSVIKISQDSRQATNVQSNAIASISSRAYTDEEYNSSSVDEEIAKIFQKQCTSSEDEFVSSYPKPHSFRKHEKTKQNNFVYNGVKSSYSVHTPRSKKGSQDDEREQQKKTSTEFVANNKRRKLFHEENKNERQLTRRSENKTEEEKRGTRQNSSSKNKSSSSRTPIKNKDSKRRNIKYKEMATQTDSAFSDDDVEMIVADTKKPERSSRCKYTHKSQVHRFQDKKMEQELNYIADNEDSNDGLLRISHKRISSCSTSSSSTDLGFDERASTTPDTDIVVGQWRTNSPDSTSALRTRVCAPPGFPEVPQNPPLTSYVCNSKNISTSSKNNNDPHSCFVKTAAAVPPAPSPMRHLYYDYPEFMDLPIYIKSSQILNNILKNNYYR
ncbi:unnamed protein product [Xylocopa violacea]|uniref:Uncharacterized protein n=1 Tax=Xylocopa violacea TaxID=135666 RepID=A0ABP1P470_XYLVO